MSNDYSYIDGHINESLSLRNALLGDNAFKEGVHRAVSIVKDCFRNKGKVLVAGNGGSAADAQHFAAEFIGRYKRERKSYPAIALTTDTSILTAWSNDYDFSTVFSRQIEALGEPRDVFIGISTSGNSKNIIEGVKKAKTIGLKTIALLGNGGGAMKNMADVSVIVPSMNTPRIQEVHTMILHVVSEEVEKTFES